MRYDNLGYIILSKVFIEQSQNVGTDIVSPVTKQFITYCIINSTSGYQVIANLLSLDIIQRTT